VSDQLAVLKLVATRLDVAGIPYVGTTPDLDREYIERWAQELTVMALWRDVTA
jgi:hypothetical protein